MNNSVNRAILVGSLGYILIMASIVAISLLMKLTTGYYPSFLLFTLYLVTLGLFAIHPAFLIAPLLVAVAAMILLSKTKLDAKLAGGISVASYYILATLLYAVKGAGDAAWGIFFLWIIWAFVLGLAASKIADRALTQ